jgi:glutamate N-acetyltransferase/amino-acid N-acetyltransferase
MMKKHSGSRRIPVPGFKFSGISSGIKIPGEMDLALIYSESPAVTAGVFTKNKVKAAPVKMAIERIASGKGQAVIINSGNANACTGDRGLKDAAEISIQAADELGISPELVYVSSTGVIGVPLPLSRIKKALPRLVKELSYTSINKSAAALMTTDTFEKVYSKKIRIGSKTGTIAGIAKGAGMICPDMATMLCFIVTDIAVTPKTLNMALKNAVDGSFNRLSVDNDMSTNDTVMAMANGFSGNKPLKKNSAYYQKFQKALSEVTYNLAKMIARDGEGATKLIEIIVKGAAAEADAAKVAMSVAKSMLVKAAVYGSDPNWGRIMAAAGYSGIEIDERNTDIYINKIKLVSRGTGTNREKAAQKLFANKEIVITIDLGSGKKTARALTCDLTEKYIDINAHYRS